MAIMYQLVLLVKENIIFNFSKISYWQFALFCYFIGLMLMKQDKSSLLVLVYFMRVRHEQYCGNHDSRKFLIGHLPLLVVCAD